MKQRAYAKINLSLDVFGVREDGYHELNSIMLPVNFYDLLEIDIAEKDSYECNWHYIRYNEHNSIYKMISVLKDRYDIKDRHRIVLHKSIPIQAGLGGGTADAAAALKLFEKLYGIKPDKEEIRDICISVGADVLFNYYNVPAQVKGIGDIIEPIWLKKPYYVLLVKPKTGISTAKAYQELDLETCAHPDIEKLRKALEEGDDFSGLIGNSLQDVAQSMNSDIKEVIDRLNGLGAPDVLMSGSGSTVFSISEDRQRILDLYNMVKNDSYYARFGKIMR
ncbi:MAG: 4-(cytidine 5'-diphospho)-2-C-methyl-D-erythritol kinase [Erysipelotrichaceae bacterium]|nr:4-(cytidine 5'-diphospho)-2-C-methyl-D-erythritol kinase [Erysipelotrichaceae bacterium]